MLHTITGQILTSFRWGPSPLGPPLSAPLNLTRIIIGSDRRPETKQGIEGKIVRFRPRRVRFTVMDMVRVRDN